MTADCNFSTMVFFLVQKLAVVKFPAYNAHIKIPFSTSENELITEADTPSKSVGGYGVFFSGIFILSIGIYLYLTIRKKSKTEMKIFTSLSLVLGLIILSCLLSPIPNYARYISQLGLFPVVIVVALLLIADKKKSIEKTLATVLIFLLICNIIQIFLLHRQ